MSKFVLHMLKGDMFSKSELIVTETHLFLNTDHSLTCHGLVRLGGCAVESQSTYMGSVMIKHTVYVIGTGASSQGLEWLKTIQNILFCY